MTYKEAVDYLESFIDYEKIPVYSYKTSIDLARMERLLELLGNPHESLAAVHIAGTKGKGSIAAMTASVLTEAGFKTGLYTSPHLIDFTERIRVDGVKISREQVTVLTQQIKTLIGQEEFTFFEVYTGLAIMYFKNCGADFVVLETGLGGRLDATNVVGSCVCGISPISLDHTDKLGRTLKEIAGEKAGIIKENSIVISAPQEPEAGEVIKDVCRQKDAELFVIGEHIFFEKAKPVLEYEGVVAGQTFNVNGIFGEYQLLKIPLLGDYQAANAAVAVGLAEGLRFTDVVVNGKAIRSGLAKVYWPGRLEVIKDKPVVVLDGAQNKASARALAAAVIDNFSYNNLILVLGISSDKDIKGVLEAITPLSHEIIFTRADHPRSADPEELKRILQDGTGYSGRITVTGNVEEAYRLALERAEDRDLVLVTGSFFILGEMPGYEVA